MDSVQLCPICSTSVETYSRYPRHVCRNCAARAKSKDGRLLAFFNESLSGGFAARYKETGEDYPAGHECYIDGIRCYADEARFGGIVIQTDSD